MPIARFEIDITTGLDDMSHATPVAIRDASRAPAAASAL